MKVAVSIFIIIICISFIIDYVCVYKAEKTDDDQQEKWIPGLLYSKKSENRK